MILFNLDTRNVKQKFDKIRTTKDCHYHVTVSSILYNFIQGFHFNCLILPSLTARCNVSHFVTRKLNGLIILKLFVGQSRL